MKHTLANDHIKYKRSKGYPALTVASPFVVKRFLNNLSWATLIIAKVSTVTSRTTAVISRATVAMVAQMGMVLWILTTIGCAHNSSPKMRVLEYRDFGPQAMAYNLLGKDKKTSTSTLTDHPLYVVVYRGAPLKKAQKKYPGKPEQGIEYRYVTADDALDYLARNIQKDYWGALTQRLKRTEAQLLPMSSQPGGRTRTREQRQNAGVASPNEQDSTTHEPQEGP